MVSAKKILVIYHANCPDGFAAAWAAWKKFGNKAEYKPTVHDSKPPDARDREVYMLDFTYKPADMRRIGKTAKKVVVVDHHISAKESVELADESLYDLKHSGAYLAWKYFHPRRKVPRIILHIEDEDLWKFRLSQTKAVNARLELLDFDFKELDRIIRAFERSDFRKKFVAEGDLLQEYRSRIVRRLSEKIAVPVRFQGHRTLAVNGAKPFISEIGNLLCKMRPPIGIVWYERPGHTTISLRSNGKVDVSKIAQKFGGGGHKAAAAFNIPRKAKKPWTYE